MSCRVIGRQAESAFLEALLYQLAEEGITEVDATFIPTAKNGLAKDFLPEHHFTAGSENLWSRSLATEPPRPESEFPIEISFAAEKAA
jgi:predicted enzyme involved in methoxymalonyl-ACP biosynthesis